MRQLGIALATCLSLVAALAASPAEAATVPLPNSMAATGDSITRAFDVSWLCVLRDCPQYSWSTGSNGAVNSQYLRILALNPGIQGHAYNDARSGAKMIALSNQLGTAAAQHVEYATVLIGANDVCTSSASTMTMPADFYAQFSAALANFFALDPGAHVYVSSLPNVNQLYNLFKDNPSAVTTWSRLRICQSTLPPGGTDASRQAVYQREVTFNTILSMVCGQYPNCRYDGGAGFAYAFTTADVSTVDYFHPSITGQHDVAALTWRASYWGAA